MSNEEQIARMAGMAGDTGGGKAPKYNVPIIKFNGNTGAFSKIVYALDGTKTETDIEEDVSFVILKNRKRLEAMDAGLSSVEFNSTSQIVTLFSNVEGKYTKVASDTVTNLREEYPVLKTQEVLYVLFNEEICKLIVKGGSSTSFYEFKDKLKDENEKTFTVKTNITVKSAKGKVGKKYFFMDFGFSTLDIPLDDIETAMTIVSKEIEKIDNYNAEKSIESTTVGVVDAPKVAKKGDFGDFSDAIDEDEVVIED